MGGCISVQTTTVVYACNPRTHEAEAGGLQIIGYYGLHSEFKVIMEYITRPVSNKISKKKMCLKMVIMKPS